MSIRTGSIIALLAIMLSGCAGTFIKEFEKRLLAGEWKKEGATQEEFYDDSFKCQMQTSYITPDGVLYDLKLFSACMYAKGWKLVPDGGESEIPLADIAPVN